MPKIISTLVLAFIIAFTSPKLLGPTNIDTSNKKVTSKEWFSLLDETLSQWEVWTGVPEPSVENLRPNNNNNEYGVGNTFMKISVPWVWRQGKRVKAMTLLTYKKTTMNL